MILVQHLNMWCKCKSKWMTSTAMCLLGVFYWEEQTEQTQGGRKNENEQLFCLTKNMGAHWDARKSACLPSRSACACVSPPVCGGRSFLPARSALASRLAWFSAISCSSRTSAPAFGALSGTCKHRTMPFSLNGCHIGHIFPPILKTFSLVVIKWR